MGGYGAHAAQLRERAAALRACLAEDTDTKEKP